MMVGNGTIPKQLIQGDYDAPHRVYARLIRLICGCFIAAISPLSAYAELQWQTQEVTTTVTSNQASVTKEYTFKNAGDKSVTLDLEADCDCLTARILPDKKTFQPQETGKVQVELILGQRTGKIERSITVVTKDSPPERVVLKLICQMPELITFEPRVVFWNADEDLATKTIKISLVKDATWKLQQARTNNDLVRSKLEPDDKQPGIYQLKLTPTGSEGMTVVTLVSDFPKEQPRTFQVFTRVFRPKASAVTPQTGPSGTMPSTQTAPDLPK